jgi:thiamine biosynthesis lipoprotein
MGTRFELVLPEMDGAREAEAAGEAALAEIEDCHRRLSRFESSSLVSHILRTAAVHPVPLDQDTFALFLDAIAVWRASEGCFDLTSATGGMDALELDPVGFTIRLRRPVSVLDLGGIAKGHALDLAARLLRDHGVHSAFLHGGTSSAIGLGLAPDGGSWRVALEGGGTVELRDSAMSVSAVWEENPHPTADPRTGQRLGGNRRVVVTGPSARLADAWSTAILVSGTPLEPGPEWTVAIRQG